MNTQDTQIPAELVEIGRSIARNAWLTTFEKTALAREIAEALYADRQRDQWQPIETAPKDGTIVNVVGRYLDATAGFPRYAGFRDEQWLEYSRFEPQPLVCWAWRPRDEWPREGRI